MIIIMDIYCTCLALSGEVMVSAPALTPSCGDSLILSRINTATLLRDSTGPVNNATLSCVPGQTKIEKDKVYKFY